MNNPITFFSDSIRLAIRLLITLVVMSAFIPGQAFAVCNAFFFPYSVPQVGKYVYNTSKCACGTPDANGLCKSCTYAESANVECIDGPCLDYDPVGNVSFRNGPITSDCALKGEDPTNELKPGVDTAKPEEGFYEYKFVGYENITVPGKCPPGIGDTLTGAFYNCQFDSSK